MPSVEQPLQDFPGDSTETGEDRLRRFLEQPRSDHQEFGALAKMMFQQGRFADCIAMARHALRTAVSADAVQLLAESLWMLNSYDDCDAALAQLVELAPPNIIEWAYRTRAKIKARRGDHESAKAILRQACARHPQDLNLLVAYTDLVAPGNTELACAELENARRNIPDSPPKQSFLLKRMTVYRAPDMRQRRGTLPTTAVSWEDACRWSDPEGLDELATSLQQEAARPMVRVEALLDLGVAATSEMRWDHAERYFQHVRRSQSGTFADIANFSAPLYAALEEKDDRELFGDLPPVVDLIKRSYRTKTSMFLASDPKYYAEFTAPFLRGLEDSMFDSAHYDVHVHLLDGEPDAWRRISSDLASYKKVIVSLSAESSRAKDKGPVYARVYYHAIRFIRLYQELKRSARPFWLLDVDANLLRDPGPSLSILTDFDLALQGQPCAFDPWNKLSAACVGISPTAGGLRFIRLVAAYIAHTKQSNTWMWAVDQMALFAVYAHLHRAGQAPKTLFLQPDFVCLNDDDTGIFQFSTGIHKYLRSSAQ